MPNLSTRYLDKPLKAHTLMQAIARANRVNEGCTRQGRHSRHSSRKLNRPGSLQIFPKGTREQFRGQSSVIGGLEEPGHENRSQRGGKVARHVHQREDLWNVPAAHVDCGHVRAGADDHFRDATRPAAQQAHVRNDSQEPTAALDQTPVLPRIAADCDSVHTCSVTPTGLEPVLPA